MKPAMPASRVHSCRVMEAPMRLRADLPPSPEGLSGAADMGVSLGRGAMAGITERTSFAVAISLQPEPVSTGARVARGGAVDREAALVRNPTPLPVDDPTRSAASGPDFDHLDDCRRLLREAGARCTGPRLRVLGAIREHGGHLTVAEIHQRITSDGRNINVSTAYRSVDRLVELGLLHAVRGAGGEFSYGLVGEPHHHALCVECGRIAEFPDRLVAHGLRAAGFHTGFRIEALVVSGLCPDCQEGRSG
ncbi:Fur family transcriptional regulator [Kitasatospora sp. NPDC092039]|uniref:Fur family transcriptional regulator n=1 Tax=Kitasatospora sp. NPDC092039 TaxID=3364086 RepID=UPI00381EDD18